MSTNMELGEGRSAVLDRARELVEALRVMPTFQRLEAAERCFRSNPEVRRLLEDLQTQMEIFQRAQQAGTLRSEQVQGAREVQARFQGHPVVQEFWRERDAAGVFLQETNRVISEILGLDFGQTVRPAGGCCS